MRRTACAGRNWTSPCRAPDVRLRRRRARADHSDGTDGARRRRRSREGLEHDPARAAEPDRRSLGRALHRQHAGGDLAERRRGDRPHRRQRRPRRGCRGRRSTGGLRGPLGPHDGPRTWPRPDAAGDVHQPRRREPCATREPRQRQAAEPGAGRHGRRGPLFRVLRRGRRQGARRGAAVPGRLRREGRARAPRRHRPHHPLELSRPDVLAARWRRRWQWATRSSSSPPRRHA